jgi:IclR family acetate operon transcriptional repressor
MSATSPLPGKSAASAPVTSAPATHAKPPASKLSAVKSLAPAVDNAFTILDCLGGHPEGIGLSDIARELGISKSSCFNILTTMLRLGAVERRGGAVTWHLGPKLVELGTATRRGYSGRTAVRGALQALVDSEQLLCLVGQVLGGRAGIVVLDRVYPHSRGEWINVPIGEVYPLTAPAMGRAVLATFEEEDARLVVTAGKGTPAKHAEQLATIAQVRLQGYSMSLAEYRPGIHAVAALVPGYKVEPNLILCLVGHAEELPQARLAKLGLALKSTARAVADLLGQERGWA